MGEASRQLEKWHPKGPKHGGRAGASRAGAGAGAGAGVGEQGQGQGRAGDSCTVFWALYMRLRYS